MSHATHGWWCGARTYPTRCGYCRSDVFYFSCNCGSKVFFDDLGGSWPEHRCLQYLVAQYGKEFVERGLAQQMMRPGIARKYHFDQDYSRAIQQAINIPPSYRIVRRDPTPNAKIHASGVLREIIYSPNIFKKLDITDTVLGKALLGPLSREGHSQITVHVGSIADEDVDSFTFFAATRMIEGLRDSLGASVQFALYSHTVPSRGAVWVAELIEPVL